MIAAEPQLHVMFNRSAAGTLREALKATGREGVVVAPSDNFSFGPIASDDGEARVRWVEETLGYTGWEDVVENSPAVLVSSLAAQRPPIVWVSPDSPQSLVGFLWWLGHMGERACSVVDIPSLNILRPQEVAVYLDKEQPLPADRRASSLALWSRLKAENAPLRVLTDSGLVSAPIDYFDADLLQHVTPEWRKMARIIGETLIAFDESGFWQTGDLLLMARLTILAETGVLEWRGDLSRIHFCDMRLPQPGGDPS